MPQTRRDNLARLWRSFSAQKDNPFVFAAEARPEPARRDKPLRLPHEEEVLREQRLTFFENDDMAKSVFGADFEFYNQALDSPDLMIKRLEERTSEISETLLKETEADGFSAGGWWEDEFWGEAEDEDGSFLSLEDDEVDEMGFDDDWQDDELYQKANKWAHRLFEVTGDLYDRCNIKDKDVYRVLVNVFLVPSKIVYASSSVFGESEEDTALDAQISLHGYTLSVSFLQRVRQSLGCLLEKKIGQAEEWHGAIMAADEIALEIQNRMIELAKRLKKS